MAGDASIRLCVSDLEMTMPDKTVFAAELAWPDYHAKVREGAVPILLPIGSMEQHGHHMPMHVDVLLPVEFARRVATEISALVAPPFTYGYKSHQKSGGGNHLPGTTSLDGATLVVTLEPCPMCAGALVAARVRRVVFGAANLESGACGTLYNLCVDPRLNHEVEVVPAVQGDAAATLLDRFFAERRGPSPASPR